MKTSHLICLGAKDHGLYSTFSTQLDEYFFELKEIHHYKFNDEVTLHIGLVVFEQFIPYLCLVDLLSYEIKSKLPDKEL